MANATQGGGRSVPPRTGPPNRPSLNPPTAPQTKEPLTFQKLLGQYQKQIAVALPRQMSADRMMRVALTAYNQTPMLRECDPLTIIAAGIQSAQLGLEPGINILGHAYLVPFRNYSRAKKEAGNPLIRGGRDNGYIMEAQLIVGYKGYLELGWRSGRCKKFGANLVHAYDTFSLHYDPEPIMRHEPLFVKSQGDLLIPVTAEQRGPIVGVYGYVQQVGGDPNVDFLTIDSLEEIRDNFSKSGGADANNPDGKGIWLDHFPVMARKTGIRAVSKWAPLSPDVQKAVGLDEAAENGLSQSLAEALDLVPTGSERGYVYLPDSEPTATTGAPNGKAAAPAPEASTSAPTQPAQPKQPPKPPPPPPPAEEPEEDENARGLTEDDFDGHDWSVLQANLRAAGKNRPAILQWLGTQTDAKKAMDRADAMRFEAEQGDGN